MGSHIVPQFGAVPDRPREQEIVADSAPALERLGWHATTSLEDGLRKTAAWYKANPGADSGPSYPPGLIECQDKWTERLTFQR